MTAIRFTHQKVSFSKVWPDKFGIIIKTRVYFLYNIYQVMSHHLLYNSVASKGYCDCLNDLRNPCLNPASRFSLLFYFFSNQKRVLSACSDESISSNKLRKRGDKNCGEGLIKNY